MTSSNETRSSLTVPLIAIAQEPFPMSEKKEEVLPYPAMDPLPLNILIEELQGAHQEKFGRGLNPRVLKQCSSMAERSQESQWAKGLLCYAKRNSKSFRLAGPSLVPSCVPLPWCSAVLYDINHRAQEDENYRKRFDIFPRGVTVLEWKNDNNGDEWSSFVAQGERKCTGGFTGGIGDEDNHQPEDNNVGRTYDLGTRMKVVCREMVNGEVKINIFPPLEAKEVHGWLHGGGIGGEDNHQPEDNNVGRTYDPGTTRKVVCMEMVNGEVAHVAGRYIDGDFYLITGSKFVHLMIRNKSDIEAYEESKYKYAKIIAATVWDTLNSLKPWKQRLLKAFLHHTRFTLVGGFLHPQNQHIVNLSHMEKPEVCFFTMIPAYMGHREDPKKGIPPHHLLDLYSALGLHTTLYTMVDETMVIARKEEIKRSINKEGEVLYFLDEDENEIGRIEIKTTWYTILRALRGEAAVTFTTVSWWCLDTWIDKTHRRFSELQEWLKFPDSYLEEWKSLAENFFEWLNNEIREGTQNPAAIWSSFPVLWNNFLKVTNQTDWDKLREENKLHEIDKKLLEIEEKLNKNKEKLKDLRDKQREEYKLLLSEKHENLKKKKKLKE